MHRVEVEADLPGNSFLCLANSRVVPCRVWRRSNPTPTEATRGSESVKKSKPPLKKGMAAEAIAQTIGKPESVVPMTTAEGKAKTWTCRRFVSQGVCRPATVDSEYNFRRIVRCAWFLRHYRILSPIFSGRVVRSVGPD